ncbi:MAG: YicC family protein [Candidatus Lindowbacteria bacterium RIFCSPLOWO2_12_FULL_62_27]|nr:MAG: YicC family protein [Candidatus Lindowbacteria bacterium RIFCSPLOWO2_12_FULL_62_27]OGH63904.1 MAG: YicC family protein [Candidatus Lindowbacteria bacterium RIFCSPLOWO2_02_FULL_62_12]
MTVKSMTGFGRAAHEHNGFAVEVLIKGVNSRFAEYNFKLPPTLSALEHDFRAQLARRIQRGKVTLTVNGNLEALTRTKLCCDKNAVQDYLAICQTLGLPTQGSQGLTAKWEALRIPGVLKMSGMEELSAKGRNLLCSLLNRCLDSFIRFKSREGRKIRAELGAYARKLRALSKQMSRKSTGLKQGEEKRIHALAGRFCQDSGALRDRIGFEIAAALDRLDVSEECARMNFHISEFQRALAAPGASVGRKLDFLLQEMNREINTIGSKGRDTDLSRWVVESKDYVERMREQVQNIE